MIAGPMPRPLGGADDCPIALVAGAVDLHRFCSGQVLLSGGPLFGAILLERVAAYRCHIRRTHGPTLDGTYRSQKSGTKPVLVQMARLQPFFPKSHGKPQVDDRRVLSGVIFINRTGLRWCDSPREYGPEKSLLNRWKRWGHKGIFA